MQKVSTICEHLKKFEQPPLLKAIKMEEEIKNKLEDLELSSDSEDEEVHTEDEPDEDPKEEEEELLKEEEEDSSDEEDAPSEEEETESEAPTKDDSGRISDNDSESDGTDSEVESKPKPTGERRRKRKRDPMRWVKEVRYYQKSVDLLIPKMPFRRLVREIAEEYSQNMRFTESSFEALQTASEDFLVQLFEDTQVQSIARNVDTIMPKDMQTALRMRRHKMW